jgi:hypothetical protein
MGTLKDSENPGAGAKSAATLQIEVQVEDRAQVVNLAVTEDQANREGVRAALGLDDDYELFERDADDALAELAGRKAVRLVAHRNKKITVQVRYEHLTKEKVFGPAKTVFKVLQWAVGKQGFKLEPQAAARANLILPSAENPLPKDDVIGKYAPQGQDTLVLDLTLRDFTNGGF